MPSRIDLQPESGVVVHKIVTSSNDGEFLDHLIEAMRLCDHSDLVQSLDKLSSNRDADIEHMCTNNHEEFVNSVNKLDQGRADCTSIATEILSLMQSYETSTDNLAAQKKNLVDSRNLRQNVDETAEALSECLELLQLVNQVHDLVTKQKHYAALRALDELRTMLHLRENSRYKIGDMIEKSVPAIQKMIAEAVMHDLNTWFYRIRDISQYIGEVAFFETEQRRTRQKERAEKDAYLGSFKLNSPIELVADETEEYDVLNNEEAQVQVDFSPLFECLHIHEALGQGDKFRAEYAVTRRRQKDLIIPTSLNLNNEDTPELKTLLEGIAGFAIVERATMKRTENLRTLMDVDELWESMCQSALTLMASAIHSVDNAETLLNITSVVSLFVQTMESWKFHATGLTAFLMTLFEKHVQLLRMRYSADFQEIVTTDDYLPMSINDLDAYDKIIDVGWYTPDTDRKELVFPVVLPFSQMYPMCCIDIRNFLSQVFSTPDDSLQRSSIVDEMIRDSLDHLLCEQIYKPLMERVSLQLPPSQVVQIMTNLEHFERACKELQGELARARTSRSRTGSKILTATEKFAAGTKKAKDRIFELINSRIDDLLDNANYKWSATEQANQPSEYMTELTKWLKDTMTSALLGLPSDIKESIYISSLGHATSQILAFALDPAVTSITPPALRRFDLDVSHFCAFGYSLAESIPASSTSPASTTTPASPDDDNTATILRRTVDELSQTVALMSSDSPDEFYDIAQRSTKYGSVNPENGPVLLEKVERGKGEVADGKDGGEAGKAKASASDRFGSVQGMMMRGLRRGGEAGVS